VGPEGGAEKSGALALDVADIAVHYGGVRALSDVSLSARHGQVVGIIGPNGAGKTTLFDVISGFCKPSHGSISFEGSDVTKIKMKSIKY